MVFQKNHIENLKYFRNHRNLYPGLREFFLTLTWSVFYQKIVIGFGREKIITVKNSSTNFSLSLFKIDESIYFAAPKVKKI